MANESEETAAFFSVEKAKLISEVIDYLISNGFVIKGGIKKPLLDGVPRKYIAYVTTAITARSGTTAGKGKAKIIKIAGAAGTATTLADAVASSPPSIDVYNMCGGSSIATGKYIQIAREHASGKWLVDVVDCS